MEVSGRGASTRPSAEYELTSDDGSHGNQCEQCKDDGITTDADGYCTDCHDYFCNSCIKVHSRQRALRDHTVLMGRDMPRQKPEKTGIAECPQHPGETIKVYCKSENILGCGLCFAVGHRPCDTALISSLCKGFETSKEVKDIQKVSEEQKKRVDQYRKLIEAYHRTNNNCYDESLKEYQTFRKDIVEKLDRLGEVVEGKAGRQKDENKKKLDAFTDTVTTLDKEMESLITQIEVHQKSTKNEMLLISVKKNQDKIKSKAEKLRQLNDDIHVPIFRFTENHGIRKELDEMISTGAMKVMSGDVSCTGKINVKASEDIEDCIVAGMVEIAPSVLALVDDENESIKTVDVNKNTITQRRQLSSPPRDITVIPGSRVAVTLPDQQQIQLFSTSQNLDPCGTVAVDGQCVAIESTGDQLIVSFLKPVKIELMNLQGQVLKSIVPATSGSTLFDYPGYMSLNRDHSVVYITDLKKNMVTSVDMEGTVLWRNEDDEDDEDEEDEEDEEDDEDDKDDEEDKDDKGDEDDEDDKDDEDDEDEEDEEDEEDDELNGSCGVVTGSNGCLYVCRYKIHAIHVVSSTGVRLRVIPQTQHQTEYPAALCISQDQDTLYVSSLSSTPDQCNNIRRLSLQ